MVRASRSSDLRSPPANPCPARFTAMPGVCISKNPSARSIASRQARERPRDINFDHDISIQGMQFCDQRVDSTRVVVDRAVKNNPARFVNFSRPMNSFWHINANAYLYLFASQFAVGRTLYRACIALRNPQSHRVICGQSGAATKVAQRPKPSRTASIKTIPPLPAHQQFRTIGSTMSRGKTP